MPLATQPNRPAAGTSRVAVVRGGALGDFVLTLPAIAALRAAAPGARLLIVGDPDRARLAGPDEVIDAGGPAWSRLFSSAAPDRDLRARFAGCRYLLAFVAGGRSSTPLVQALDRLSPRVAVYDPRLPAHGCRHAARHLLAALAALDIRGPEFPVPRVELSERWDRGDAGPVVVHPGSGSRTKSWPPERFAAVMASLAAQGVPTAVLWGPAEEERAAEFHPHFPGRATLLRPGSALELARLLRAARLYVGNDSGPGHLAAAVGTPTVSIFGPTRPEVWRPLGPRARVIRAPCGVLAALEAEEVQRAVAEALEEPAP